MFPINRNATTRAQLNACNSVEILRTFANDEGDAEVILFLTPAGRFGVHELLIEVPEDGEEIAPGEEVVEILRTVTTESRERAEARFDAAVAALA